MLFAGLKTFSAANYVVKFIHELLFRAQIEEGNVSTFCSLITFNETQGTAWLGTNTVLKQTN